MIALIAIAGLVVVAAVAKAWGAYAGAGAVVGLVATMAAWTVGHVAGFDAGFAEAEHRRIERQMRGRPGSRP